MTGDRHEIDLSAEDLRAVAGFAAGCAEEVLDIFEAAHPNDRRPREAVDAAWTFARGGRRAKVQRDAAWAALKAAGEAGPTAAGDAARSAMLAASTAYLHPLANASQVTHILGAAAHAARAAELAAGGDGDVGAAAIAEASRRATPELVDILRRYPTAPSGGGRVGELMRHLNRVLRSTS